MHRPIVLQSFPRLLTLLAISLPVLFIPGTPGPKAAPNSTSIAGSKEFTPGNKTVNIHSLYDQLALASLGLQRQVYEYAVTGYQNMKASGTLRNDKILSIVDFSKPSSKKRLYILDMLSGKLLFHTYVAHGMKSGKQYATRFSNIPESNQSSLGFYQTLGSYFGDNGYSLRLSGVEKGFNDNAASRAIVMHGAPYVNEKLIKTQGYIGRSWGCPAVPSHLSKPIIDKIKQGTCLFIYSEDTNYLVRSNLLKNRPDVNTGMLTRG